MELNVYRLYTSHEDSKKLDVPPINIKKISLSRVPSPKLIKYGFNKTTDNFDLIDLMKNNHYRVGLSFDFCRTDVESACSLGKKTFNVTNIDNNFFIFWEILSLFGMFFPKQTVLTNIKNTITNVTSVYSKMNEKIDVTIAEVLPPKEKATLVVNKYSDIDLEEDAIVHLILTDLVKIIPTQVAPGSSMILQIFSCQTAVMTELIFFLSSLYNESYIVKPLVSSDLSNEKYLVLCDMKKNVKMFELPKTFSADTYISSLNVTLPIEFVTIIQCINSDLIPKKYSTYTTIKSYLASKAYGGALYQEMFQSQNKRVAAWIAMFTDFSNLENLLKSALDRTDERCIFRRRIENVFN